MIVSGEYQNERTNDDSFRWPQVDNRDKSVALVSFQTIPTRWCEAHSRRQCVSF